MRCDDLDISFELVKGVEEVVIGMMALIGNAVQERGRRVESHGNILQSVLMFALLQLVFRTGHDREMDMEALRKDNLGLLVFESGVVNV